MSNPAQTTQANKPIYLLNAMPLSMLAKPEAIIHVKQIDRDTARLLTEEREVVSFIGHEATAQIMSVVLMRPVAVNRAQLKLTEGEAIIITLTSRLPEGAVIRSAEDLAKVGYQLYYVSIS